MGAGQAHVHEIPKAILFISKMGSKEAGSSRT